MKSTSILPEQRADTLYKNKLESCMKADKLHSVISYTTEFHYTYNRFLMTLTCSFSRQLQVALTLQTMHREKSRRLPGLGWPVKMNISGTFS